MEEEVQENLGIESYDHGETILVLGVEKYSIHQNESAKDWKRRWLMQILQARYGNCKAYFMLFP